MLIRSPMPKLQKMDKSKTGGGGAAKIWWQVH
jgi:hypothetical protein